MRVAENQVTFRRANEQIEEQVQVLGDELTVRFIPFLCECSERRCTNVIRLTIDEYEDIRSGSRRFAVLPGHENDSERLLSRNDRFSLVEKVGEAGRIAAEMNKR